MLRESYRNFNTCLFTQEGTPLPLDDKEKLLYMARDVGFSIAVGEGGFFSTYWHKAERGCLFLTNFRLIYIPQIPSVNFISFFCKSTSVMDAVQHKKRIKLQVSLEGSIPGEITFKMRQHLPDTFIKQLTLSQEYLQVLE